MGHKHGYAGPGRSTNENKMVRYPTGTAAHWRLQESSGAFQSRAVYRRLTCIQSLGEPF